MELKRALELRLEYSGDCGVVRVDADDYLCLNDMVSFFPSKRLDNWLRLDTVVDFVKIVESQIPQKVGIMARRGKGGGTWAHRWIAMKFAMWLSPEFELSVIRAYEAGSQRKQDWNVKRIFAASNYKIMSEAVKNAHETPKPYHFSNEALMLNEIVFGVREGHVRETATERQLDDIASLEGHNGAYIDAGMDYQARKELLTRLYREKRITMIK